MTLQERQEEKLREEPVKTFCDAVKVLEADGFKYTPKQKEWIMERFHNLCKQQGIGGSFGLK